MKNLESKIYDVLKEAGVPVKQAKKMAKKTAQKAEFFIWEKKQGEDKNSIPKKETELDRAVDKAVDAAVDAVSDSKLGKLLDENMAELFGPEMGKMISRVENKVDDSVITPRPKAGVVTRLKMNLRSPSPDVDMVSGSPYTSSNHQTDGQPNCSGSDCLQHSFPDSKPGRGLPSIDDTSEDDVDKDM